MKPTTNTRPHPRANGEDTTGHRYLSRKMLGREAAKVVNDLGLNITGPRLRVLIDRFIRDGRADVDFRTWFLSYADPTGNEAVRNVMRERAT